MCARNDRVAGPLRVPDGEDDGRGEHADRREERGLPCEGDDGLHGAIEVGQSSLGPPEGVGYCREKYGKRGARDAEWKEYLRMTVSARAVQSDV